MHKLAMMAVMLLMAMTVLTSCFIAGPADPYVYSPVYHAAVPIARMPVGSRRLISSRKCVVV